MDALPGRMHAPPTTIAVEPSSSLVGARDRFLRDLGDWIQACLDDIPAGAVLDGHDQGTFTVAWAPYAAATGDPRLIRFMKALRDAASAHFHATGAWRHGYWAMGEAHHGTEHHELFLGTLWRLDPTDSETLRQFVDAAEHLGNWVPEVPAWFDWDTGLFRSMHFGTEGVRREPGDELNVADHFRCVGLALRAHEMTGEVRYLDLAQAHAGRWSEAILSGDDLPVGLAPNGAVTSLAGAAESHYRAFAGMAGALDNAVDRAENLLASGAVNALLRLWALTGTPAYRRAAERLLDVLATQLPDPDAGAAADVLRLYRRLTGDHRYDRHVLSTLENLNPFAVRTLGIAPDVPRAGRPAGIGKRKDMPDWFEEGTPRRHNPILLSVAAEILANEPLVTRALDLARAYFALARQVYPHGREHGCSARTVSAIARGHGRENNAGVVTAVLAARSDGMME